MKKFEIKLSLINITKKSKLIKIELYLNRR